MAEVLGMLTRCPYNEHSKVSGLKVAVKCSDSSKPLAMSYFSWVLHLF